MSNPRRIVALKVLAADLAEWLTYHSHQAEDMRDDVFQLKETITTEIERNEKDTSDATD